MLDAVKTNGDYIRSLSDEELAELIIGTLCWAHEPYKKIRAAALLGNDLLDWLKSPIEEGLET